MSKTVKVTYNSDTLETKIVVDGHEFDTSRIAGKEVADWAYPFMVRKVRWDGFYDEMVKALEGEKAFDLVFEGSDEALSELREALEEAPVNIVSGEQNNTVTINYDADALTTDITVNGNPFDTSRINGKEIEDWVSPFMMRKIKWDGIFAELKNAIGSEEYEIRFTGSREAGNVLMGECPENVKISCRASKQAGKSNDNANSDDAIELENQAAALDDEGRYSESFQLRLKAADMGNIISLSNLGWHYEFGNGVTQDYNKAFSYYKEAAEAGNAWSQRKTGICYEEGLGVNQDMTEAVRWYLKAAEQGHAESQWAVGTCYLNGYGVAEDEPEAFRWFMESANQGFVNAESALGECYLNGYGIEPNEEEAVKWFEKAAEQEDAFSQCMLGVAYMSNSPFEPNYNVALEWFEKSVANGNNANPQIYISMITCLSDIGYKKMDKYGVGYKEAALTFPEFQRIVEICDFAINNFDCCNAENGIFYLELAKQYGFAENWDKAVKFCEMAANFGVDGAADLLSGYKKAKLLGVGMGVAEKLADSFGLGAAFKLGKAIGNIDGSESIASKGADALKSLFSNDD